MNRTSGFTLLELLVVIAIIGLLSTMAVVSLNNAREKAKIAACKADLKNIVTAIDLARDDKNTHLMGVTGSGCSDCSCRPFDDATMASSACINRTVTTYQSLGFASSLKDPWGDFYMIDENEYEFSGNLCRRDGLRSLNCGSIFVPYFFCN